MSKERLSSKKRSGKIHLYYFRKLLHPPPAWSVIPSFPLHAVLHFLHSDFPLPAAREDGNHDNAAAFKEIASALFFPALF